MPPKKDHSDAGTFVLVRLTIDVLGLVGEVSSLVRCGRSEAGTRLESLPHPRPYRALVGRSVRPSGAHRSRTTAGETGASFAYSSIKETASGAFGVRGLYALDQARF